MVNNIKHLSCLFGNFPFSVFRPQLTVTETTDKGGLMYRKLLGASPQQQTCPERGVKEAQGEGELR